MKKTITRLAAVLSFSACVAVAQSESDKVIQGVNYVGLSVSNLEHTSDFYSNASDLQQVQDSRIENNASLNALAGRDVKAKTRLLKSSNAQLRLMEFEAHSQAALDAPAMEVHGPGIAHICFQVAASTQTYERFLESGATPIGNTEMIQLNPRNPVVYAYARDNDGAIFEVEHIDFSKVSTPRKNDYRIRHISLATPDMEPMVRFYSILMDEPEPRRLGVGGTLAGENFDKVSGYVDTQMEMAWFQVRNLELELTQYHSHPTERESNPRPVDALGYNMIVFDVSSIEAAREKLVSAGGSLVDEPSNLDGGEILFGRDPDGNLLGFQVAAKDAAVSSQNFKDNGI